MTRSHGRSSSPATDAVPTGLDEVRAAISRNCKLYADDPSASTAAADLIITMRRTTTALQTTMEAYAQKYALSPSKIIILMALAASNGALPQAEIARQLAVSLGSLTALISSLEKAGIVNRFIDRNDRRVSLIALTAKGLVLVNRFAPDHYRREALAVSVLTAREQRTLIALLDKLREHQSSASAIKPAPGGRRLAR